MHARMLASPSLLPLILPPLTSSLPTSFPSPSPPFPLLSCATQDHHHHSPDSTQAGAGSRAHAWQPTATGDPEGGTRAANHQWPWGLSPTTEHSCSKHGVSAATAKAPASSIRCPAPQIGWRCDGQFIKWWGVLCWQWWWRWSKDTNTPRWHAKSQHFSLSAQYPSHQQLEPVPESLDHPCSCHRQATNEDLLKLTRRGKDNVSGPTG